MRIALALAATLVCAQAQDLFTKKPVPRPERISMAAVWDLPGHASAPELLRYDNRWLVAFREASGPGKSDGAIRVVTSLDGTKWSSAARLDHAIADLDRPRLTAMPDGQLLLTAAVTLHAGGPEKYRTYAWKSRNGREWEGPTMLGEEGIQLGPIDWRRGKAYALGHAPGAREPALRGYMSEFEMEFATSSPATPDSAQLGHASIAFQPDDTALGVASHVDGSLRLGLSRPPYHHWQWKDLAQKVADPRVIRLDDGRLIVSGADAKGRPSIFWLDPAEGTLRQASALSAEATFEGAALRWYEGSLWAAYRSTNPNNGAAGIYLARIKLP